MDLVRRQYGRLKFSGEIGSYAARLELPGKRTGTGNARSIGRDDAAGNRRRHERQRKGVDLESNRFARADALRGSAYFAKWSAAKQALTWKAVPIEFLPGRAYLFGKTA